MTSNISSSSTGHAYRLRPMPMTSINNNSTPTGPPLNTTLSSSSNPSYYGSSSVAPTVASPTWSYSSPSQLARKYANIAPIWCHITKPRQLKKKFASTFHQAQSLVNFYNEDRAPSERRGSLTQAQQQNQAPSQQQQTKVQPTVHSTGSTRPHPSHHQYESNSYRQQYAPHYPAHDLVTDSSAASSSSLRAKKKYTGGALTMHVSSRLQSPPPPPNVDEKFSNPTERKARIDQLKDLVFNTRVKDTMVGRTDSKNRSTTNLHKANSYKRIDQVTNPIDDYPTSIVPPTTPARKDSHYYHYHLPSNTVSSSISDNLNRPIVPPPPLTALPSTISHPTYNYDYLRAKSKEHTRPTYYEPTYVTSSTHTAEIPSASQIGSSNSAYVGSAITANALNTYRTFDDHGYTAKPVSAADKNSSYTAITSFPSYQTPGSSKRRIKKYLMAKSNTSAILSHQTEPIVSNFEHISLVDEDKTVDGDNSSVIIANTHAMTPSPPPASAAYEPIVEKQPVASLHSTVSIPPIPVLSPPPSPPLITANGANTEPAAFSTPNAQLSPSPPSNNINQYTLSNKIPSVIVVPLSASLTSLNKQQPSLKSTTNSLLELVLPHSGKEQSPSRSIAPPAAEDGCAFRVRVCACARPLSEETFAVLQLFLLVVVVFVTFEERPYPG